MKWTELVTSTGEEGADLEAGLAVLEIGGKRREKGEVFGSLRK